MIFQSGLSCAYNCDLQSCRHIFQINFKYITYRIYINLQVSLKQHLVLHSQRKIRPTPSPQDNSLQKVGGKKADWLSSCVVITQSLLSEGFLASLKVLRE